MQEEVENRTVNLAISTSRLSARTIVAGIRMYLQHQRNAAAKKPTKVEGVHGKQTVKELIGQNQGVSRMPLGDASIRDFEREARKYGVDFAVTKDKSVHPPQYLACSLCFRRCHCSSSRIIVSSICFGVYDFGKYFRSTSWEIVTLLISSFLTSSMTAHITSSEHLPS